jgi:hypothetical protein
MTLKMLSQRDVQDERTRRENDLQGVVERVILLMDLQRRNNEIMNTENHLQ